MIFRLSILLLFVFDLLQAQNIPLSRRVEWNIAGISGGIPCRTNVYNFVTSFAGDPSGVSDNSAKLATALSSTPADAVIYFPNGSYKFNSTITVPSNKVLRGQSASGVTFNCTPGSGNNCVTVQGSQLATSSTVTANLTKGGNTLTLANASGFSVGDDILMKQANNGTIADDPASWADDLRGQLFVVSAKSGNTLTLDRTFTLDYSTADLITVYKLSLKKNVGFESFTINRADANSGTNNETFLFDLTAEVWMTCISSLNTGRYHVYLNDSRNAEIRGCYFYEAKAYGGGGDGYGVLCQDHVGECLIENNIFRKLRHALIVKEGSSRNVYGYNYSREATWTSTGIPADLSIHGHYPYYNLFESNIIQRVTITDAWGRSGPGNTFLRNRMQGDADWWVQLDSDNQQLEGNEVTNAGNTINANRDGSITGTVKVANNINGTIDATPGSSVPNSYYLASVPAFYGALSWPSMGYGTPFNTNTIPAFTRYSNYVSSTNTQDLMAHCNCSVSLPVDIIRLEAQYAGAVLRVEWEVANEIDIQSYSVEVSTDGEVFTTMDIVNAGSSSYVSELYDTAGIKYLRLKIQATNSVDSYSEVVSLFTSGGTQLIMMDKNSVFNISEESITIGVFDLQGRLLLKEDLDAQEGIALENIHGPVVVRSSNSRASDVQLLYLAE